MYKRGIISLIIILFLLINIFSVYSEIDTGEPSEGEVPPDPQASIDAGQKFYGTATQDADVQVADSDVGFSSGSSVDFDGQNLNVQSKDTINIDEGQVNDGEVLVTKNTVSVKEAESVSINNIDATGVVDLNVMKNTNSFDIAHADALSVTTTSGTTTLTNVDNLNYLNGNYEFDHADYIQTDKFEAFNIDNFDLNAQKFTTTSADTLTSDCLEISNINNAEFIVDNNKLFSKTDELNIVDCLNKNVKFEGESIIVTKSLPYSYSISKGNLTVPFDEFDQILTTDSTLSATLNNFGFTTIEMLPSSSFAQKYRNNKDKDFSVEVSENSSKFLLFLRNSESEDQPDISYCESCGMIDFVENKIQLKGSVNYKKQGSYVYQSYDNNEALMQLDNDFIMIDTLNLDNKNPKAGRLADIYNGDYLIYETMEKVRDSDEVVARVALTSMHPLTLKQYLPFFNEKHRLITFENGALIFDPNNPNKTTIRSEAFGGIDAVKQEIQAYQAKFTQCMSNITTEFLGWLDE